VESVATEQFAAINPVIAQSVALVGHANAYLRGKRNEPSELVGVHSTFSTTHEVSFDRLGPGDRPFTLADGTAPWLRRLKKEEVVRMRLVLVPLELQKANRIAGLPEPRWGFVTEGDVGTELWAPNWTVRIGINPKIVPAPWKVAWQAERSERSFVRGDRNLDEALEELAIAIRGIESFVKALGSENEKATFEELFGSLAKKAGPTLAQHPDLFEGVPIDKTARKLGQTAALAIGLFIAAGWKDRRIGHPQIQEAFDAARAEVWRTSLVALQSSINTLAA
jgi:hypothetical protein